MVFFIGEKQSFFVFYLELFMLHLCTIKQDVIHLNSF